MGCPAGAQIQRRRHKVAVSESSRFSDAADAYWTSGPKRAIEYVCGVLQEAQHRGEVCVGDCALAARQFVAMLRGDLHLEIVFGMRGGVSPAAAEIQAHVKSVVAVFLYGAGIVATTSPGTEQHAP
jgi:hypothetical protein